MKKSQLDAYAKDARAWRDWAKINLVAADALFDSHNPFMYFPAAALGHHSLEMYLKAALICAGLAVYDPKKQITAEGWTIEQALAMWFALAHPALVVAATKAYAGEQEAISRVVRLCEPYLMKRWSVPMGISIMFQSAVERSESEAFAALSACATGHDLATFEIRYTDRILGVPVPFSVRNKSNPLMDYFSINTEPQAGLAFSHYVGLLFMELVESLVPLL